MKGVNASPVRSYVLYYYYKPSAYKKYGTENLIIIVKD